MGYDDGSAPGVDENVVEDGVGGGSYRIEDPIAGRVELKCACAENSWMG